MAASPNPPRSYVFGDFVLEPLQQRLRHATETLVDAPEFDRGSTGPRLIWLWIAVGLGLAAAAWWLLN